ncbi:helix-turn-helix transcriptional regulator [Fodinibius sp. Rm-B-1B1-1]|uniref:helix-turn-helix transcriptional regulator n=1 Tax=Fodinibius alkaliphilus TaxID=3140241 RepID=UPI00315B2746
MTINLLHSREIEGKALSNLLKQKGYDVTRRGFAKHIKNNKKTIYVIDTEFLFQSNQKKLDKLCSPSNYIALVGKISHLYWLFQFSCHYVSFISNKEKIKTLDTSISSLAQKKSFLSKKTKLFLNKTRQEQHNILLKRNLSSPLTSTELKTMCQISLGKTTKEIAEEWCRSHHTINNHRKNIIKKLSLSDSKTLGNFCLQKKHALKTLLSIEQNESSLDKFEVNLK